MSLAFGFLIGWMLAVGALAIIDNWRVVLPLLAAAEMCRIGLLSGGGLPGAFGWPVLLVEAVASVSVAAMLLVTALTFTREYNTEQLDEFALLELRRAVRRAQQRAHTSRSWTRWIVPSGAVLLAVFATLLLSRAYPISRDPLIDTAAIFAVLCGLLILVTSGDVLKLGLGLLLAASSAKLLYFGVVPRINVLHVALLELLTLVLAVVIAYLSGLLYGRLHTLDTDSLFERR